MRTNSGTIEVLEDIASVVHADVVRMATIAI